MQVRLLRDNFVSGACPNPRKGEIRNLPDDFAQHLCDIGCAEAVKIEAPVQTKKSSASPADPASTKKTTQKRESTSKKSSPSTTAGE